MNCCGGSRKAEQVLAEHKFAYIVCLILSGRTFRLGLTPSCRICPISSPNHASTSRRTSGFIWGL